MIKVSLFKLRREERVGTREDARLLTVLRGGSDAGLGPITDSGTDDHYFESSMLQLLL